MSGIWAFAGIENNHDVYRGMCNILNVYLREHAMKIINFEKANIMPLTNELYESYLN